MAAAGVLAAWALPASAESRDIAAACAAAARLPTPDDKTGANWEQLDADKAIAECTAALAADNGDMASRANLARALLKAGRQDEGMAALRVAAEAGNGQAMRQMGLELAKLGTPEAAAQGREWLRKAVDAGYVRAIGTLADALLTAPGDQRDIAGGLALYERAVALGDTGAMVDLGLLYDKGEVVPADDARETALYRMAADLGDANAMELLGWQYSHGEGVAKDLAVAAEWYRRGAEGGDADAMNEYARALLDGEGVPADAAAAFKWFSAAREAGSMYAASNLALMYENGRGVDRKDLAKALALYREGAEGGDPFAMRNLGEQYTFGLGVPADYAKALEWYRKAVEAGDVDSLVRIGNAYEKGQGTTRDIAKAIEWYERGREKKSTLAMRALSTLYENGVGVPQDLAKSLTYLREAAEANDAVAMRSLAAAYRYGRGVTADMDASRDWFRKAAATDGGNSALELGRNLYTGADGFAVDYTEARKWLGEALARGIDNAGPLLVLATLSDQTLPDREQAAVDLLVSHAAREDGWALAALAHPGERLRQIDALPDPAPWRAKLDSDQRPETLFAAAEAMRQGLIVEQDLGQALRLAGRPAAADPFSAKGQELELLVAMKLYGAALRRYEAFVSSPEFTGASEELRRTFEARFAATIENSASSAMGEIDTMVAMADRGIAPAARALGTYYGSDLNPEQDLELARHWYGRAAELGDSWSLISLGYMTSFGFGGPEDKAAALALYKQAAALGNVTARHNIGAMYREGSGVEKNPEEAYRWFQLATQSHYLNSYANIAGMKFRGEGTALDPKGAIEALRTMIDCLDINGLYMLAQAYFEGAGVERDAKKGLKWMRFAASFDQESLGALGMAQANALGWTDKPNLPEAFKWLEEAQLRGNQLATTLLTDCATDRTAACLRKNEDFRITPLMEKPVAVMKDVPGVELDDRPLLAVRDQAMVAADSRGVELAFHDLDLRYRIAGEGDKLVASNALRIIDKERSLNRLYGSKDNYFALFESSCAWASASNAAKTVGKTEAAVMFAKVAVNRLQQARRFISGLDDDVRECFIAAHRDRYRELSSRFLDLGRFDEAETVLGMLKDFELENYTGEAGDRGTSLDMMPMTTAQERVLKDFADAALRFDGDPHGAGFTPAFERLVAGLAGLERDRQVVAQASDGGDSVQGELRQLRATGRAAVQAIVQPDQIYWLITTPDEQKLVKIRLGISDLTRMVREYHTALSTADPEVQTRAQDLYRAIFAPVDAELQSRGIGEVLLSLDKTLRYVPIAALHDGKEWLVERYAFGQFRKPADIATASVKAGGSELAGFGMTKKSGNFVALPMVAEELRTLVRQPDGEGLLPGTARLDEQFDEASLAQAASGSFGAIHVASHFKLDPRSRDKSFLLLGNGDHLPLAAFSDGEIKFANAKFLALSACNTAAATREANGSELESLAEIVRGAGAGTVLASLWQVADQSTPLFMSAFYKARFLAGETSAQSLRDAQLELIRRGRAGEGPTIDGSSEDTLPFDHPFYWAPFIVTG